MTMRVIICGGRGFKDWGAFQRIMQWIAEQRFPKIVPDEYGNFLWGVRIAAGGAPGADYMASQWAAVENCDYKEYKAQWREYGRSAGPRRNEQMLKMERPDLVIAFPGGDGTRDMCDKAERAGVEVLSISREHGLYKTGDQDAPDQIKDRNGEVVLGLCKVCRRAEADLTEPCVVSSKKQ